jgi:hypothetical protein
MGNIKDKISIFYGEARRRKVLSSTMLYIVTCWVILQVSDIVFPLLGISEVVHHWLIAIIIFCLPLAIVLSWFYDITANGIVKVAGFTERRVHNNISPYDDRRISRDKKNLEHRGWYIYAEAGPLVGLEFKICDEITLGRSIDCEITLGRSYVSRKHASLRIEKNILVIEDLGSSNGTFVNGIETKSIQMLHHGDEIKFKDVVFRVKEYASEIRKDDLLDTTVMFEKNN